jgi:hypothetical protein
MTARRRTRSARIVAAGLATLVLAGCSFSAPDKTSLGVRRVGLDLAYSDNDLKVAVPPRIILKYVPAPPAAILAALPSASAYLPPPTPTAVPPVVPPCPKAPAGSVPEQAATVAITTAPVAGTYLQRNVGTIKVSGTTPLTFQYPEVSQFVIRNVKTEIVTDPSYGRESHTTFVVEDQITPTFKIVSSYLYDPRQLTLLRRDTISGATITTFRPTPGVEVLAFTGQGGSWTGTGIDTVTLDTMTVQGSIAAPEAVDVCGTLIDAERVSTDEKQVDVANRSQSGTRVGQPSITHYATQFGGLPVRREQHTSQVVRTEKGPVTLETDVVSTMMSVQPVPRVSS